MPSIFSSVQNISPNLPITENVSYTRMIIRNLNYTEPIKFGDTEYYFSYITGEIHVNAPFESELILMPQAGRTYESKGIELKVENVSSDYISNFIVINVRPLVDNYMFSTYYYTEVEVSSGTSEAVNISSGLVNQTNQYSFSYYGEPRFGGRLTIQTSTLSKEYTIYENMMPIGVKNDFDIEIRVFKADTSHTIFYVKPLY